MSVDKVLKELLIVYRKHLKDGTVLQKLSSFTIDGRGGGFYRNGVIVADLVQRLTLFHQSDLILL